MDVPYRDLAEAAEQTSSVVVVIPVDPARGLGSAVVTLVNVETRSLTATVGQRVVVACCAAHEYVNHYTEEGNSWPT